MADIEVKRNVKDKRGANFTKSVVEMLIDIVSKYKSTIENKRTDATTWKDKSYAWERICEEFNATSRNFFRSVKTLKAKYDGVKKNLRKKCATLRKEQTKTGGGVPECSGLDANEEKVLSMTQLGMVGMSSRFDNDNSGTNNIQNEQQIEYIEENDVFEFLQKTGEIPWQNRLQDEYHINDQEASTSTNVPATDDTIDPETVNPLNTSSRIPKQPDINTQGAAQKRPTKFIHKNKKNKRNMETRSNEDLSSLKKEVLQAQKEFITEERAMKSKIYKMMMENLGMDLKIKQEKLRRLQVGVDDENRDAEYCDADYNHYLDTM